MNRTFRQIAVGVAVIILLLVVVPRSGSAQTVGTLALGAVTHSADGTTTLPVTGSAAELASLEVLLDGESVPFEVVEPGGSTASRIVFAVENSVSMTPFQLSEVQNELLEVSGTLGADDQVSLVTFGGAATVAVPLTTDHAAFDAAVNSLSIDGGSALYSGVATAGEALAGGTGPALLVLVTYGWDWGGASSHTRDASIAAVNASGASVYVQSMVFDGSVDVGYLSPLATDGIAHNVTEIALLSEATALLEGATPAQTLNIAAPTLALGTHELQVTSGAGASQSALFEVTNDGLLSVAIADPAEATDPIQGTITSPADLGSFELIATLNGEMLDVTSSGTFEVDPWAFSAGNGALEVIATVSGEPAAQSSSTIRIPTLDPALLVDQSDEQVLVATLQAQPGAATALVAIVDGAVVAETTTGRLEVDRPTSDSLTFEARNADGDIVASEQVSATAVVEAPTSNPAVAAETTGTPIWQSPTMLLVPLGLIVVVLLLRRRGSRRPSPVARLESERAASLADRDFEPIDDSPAETEAIGLGFTASAPHTYAEAPDLEEEVESEPALEPMVAFEPRLDRPLAPSASSESDPAGEAEVEPFIAFPTEAAPTEAVPTEAAPTEAAADLQVEAASEPVREEQSEPTPLPVRVEAPQNTKRRTMFRRNKAPSPSPIQSAQWVVVIRTPDGDTQRLEVGAEPVSIGASKLCTVTLEGDAVRFVHLVVAREGRELKAHQFGPVVVNGQERDVEDGQLLTEAVMEIGDVALWLERSVEVLPETDAA